MMDYAAQIADLKLFTELKNSAGRDGISETDVAQLVGMVNHAASVAGPLLALIPLTFRQYTNHDIDHCRNLIGLMGRFIPEETLKRLNGLELAVLILSALLHDFGMFVKDEERAAFKQAAVTSPEYGAFIAGHHARASAVEEARAAGEYERAEAIQDSLLADYFRRMHPQRARDNVRAHLAGRLVFRELDISNYVLDVCESHAWGVYESGDPLHPEKTVSQLPTNCPVHAFPLNLQYIACCLRLADIMDFDRSRTPVVVFHNINFTDAKSWEEWNKHLAVGGWTINDREVSFRTECTHPSFYVAVMEFLDWVDAELSNCRRLVVKEAPAVIAERYRLHLPPVADRWDVEMKDKTYLAGGFRFQLEYERIMQLLMDKSLYPDPSLFLRELLQNALDACRNMEALAKEYDYAGYTPRIAVWDFSDDSTDPRVVFQDNGVGMSRKIVENYFMRVGRSYYRSPEFDAERARLKSKGIELEATSQFGIGILSCFMVADRFEVETRRAGDHPDHRPLHIIIEGPTKYFTIQLIDPPPQTPFPLKPTSDQDDGPPRHPGTRITVHLRPETKLDAAQTLDTFAANVDYDIAIYRCDSPARRLIPRRRWESAEQQRSTLADAVSVSSRGRSLFSLYADHASEHTPDERYIPRPGVDENLKEVLALSRVPLERYEFSRHLGGGAWLWLLRDEAGGICPQRGYLSISADALYCTGLPGFLGRAESYLGREAAENKEWQTFVRELRDHVGDAPSRQEVRALSKVVENAVLLSNHSPSKAQSERAQTMSDYFVQGWFRLSADEQAATVEYYESFAAGGGKWFEVPGVAEQLLRGERGWAGLSPVFSDSLPLNAWPQALALHGVLLPAGVVKWNPMGGYARKLRLLSLAGGAQIDARGASTPVPAASRLFVEYQEADKVMLPFARAVLRHAAELTTQGAGGQDWQAWFSSLLSSIKELYFWPEALFSEYELCEATAGYQVGALGKNSVGRQELIRKYGRWVPVSRFSDDAIHIYNDSTVILLTFRPRRKRNGQWEVDMETLLQPEEETIDKAMQRLNKDVRGW